MLSIPATDSKYRNYTTSTNSYHFRWDFIQKCSRLAASNGCLELAKDVINVLVEFSIKPYDIGEAFVIDAIASNKIELTMELVKHWSVLRNDLVRRFP